MKKYFKLFLMLLIFVCWNVKGTASSETLEVFLKKHQLSKQYEESLVSHRRNLNEKQLAERIDRLKQVVKSSFNEAYKLNCVKEFIENSIVELFDPLLGVRYDPLYSINYLDSLENKTLSQNFQLMVLWQVYQPQKIKTNAYKETASKAHEMVTAYLANKKNWQASWRDEEYESAVGENYQNCYADLKCLLDIIPYWMAWKHGMDVYIPCKTAQKYDKVAYLDIAGGGHGAHSFLTSDCSLYQQYDYEKELEKYVLNIQLENREDDDDTIRFAYYASSNYEIIKTQYQPDFNIQKQEDWTKFPYTGWAVSSFYNFRKFNDMINYKMGYKKAVEQLTQHYSKAFHVSHSQARNKALAVLNPPSSLYWDRITPDNLYYMILTGAPWEKIRKKLPMDKKMGKLLEFSVAFPRNMAKMIELGKKDADFTVDVPNDFGKTPIMLAAQYGYLETVQLLLENGASINRQTDNSDCWNDSDSFCIHNGNRTALMYALQEGQYDVVKYLLKNGADITLKDSKGNTAYQYLLGKAPFFDPHISMGIISGKESYRYGEPQSRFSVEQLTELKPLLEIEENKASDVLDSSRNVSEFLEEK